MKKRPVEKIPCTESVYEKTNFCLLVSCLMSFVILDYIWIIKMDLKTSCVLVVFIINLMVLITGNRYINKNLSKDFSVPYYKLGLVFSQVVNIMCCILYICQMGPEGAKRGAVFLLSSASFVFFFVMISVKLVDISRGMELYLAEIHEKES